jgi:hypothetical protein
MTKKERKKKIQALLKEAYTLMWEGMKEDEKIYLKWRTPLEMLSSLYSHAFRSDIWEDI